MIDFDQEIFNIVNSKKAFYQRYSDDLIIVCDQDDESFFNNLIRDRIAKVKLEIQPRKTNIYRYQRVYNVFKGGIVDKNNNIIFNKQLEYLGFEYDGNKVRIKKAGFSKFYRSMKRGFQRGIYFASKASNKTNKIFKTRLYKRFTYKGAKRRLIYQCDSSSKTGFRKTKKYYWGNYISYIEKANKIMKSINGDDTIKKQSSNFWKNFSKEMKKAQLGINNKLKKQKNNFIQFYHKK